MPRKLCRFVLSAICLTGPLASNAADNPLAKYLDVPGATTTLPVSSAKSPFPLEFAEDARKKFENFHYQLGGDHALYYNLHLSEVLHTAMSKPNAVYRPLEKALAPDVGDKVSFTTKEGELTLNEYVVHPNHRVQAVVMVHKGKIVYETYPGMNPTDHHVWMSPGKTTVGLVIAQLEAEGKIDMDREVVEYLPEFKGTNWDGIKMIDAANMATRCSWRKRWRPSSIPSPSSCVSSVRSSGRPTPPRGRWKTG
jgi:CubicO group peptidase (beta-lactamase class C family)